MPDQPGQKPAYRTSTTPAVMAIVDHFVNIGFDPGLADYDETALAVLDGLEAAGYELLECLSCGKPADRSMACAECRPKMEADAS